MGATAHVRLVIYPGAIRALRADPEVHEYILRAGEDFAGELRAATPRASGAGAESVAARDMPGKEYVRAGWDAAHWYLIFPEYGTKYQPAQRFTRTLLDRYRF